MSDEFILGAYSKHRPRQLGEYIVDLKCFFSALQKVDPAFSRLFYRSKSLPGFQAALSPDLSNLQDLILQYNNFDSRDYDHPDQNGRPTLESNSGIGFITSFWDGKAAIKGGLEIGVSGGSPCERLTDAVVIEFPYEEFSDDWLTVDALTPLFEAVIKVWRPAYAIVTSHAFRDKVEIDKTKATIGWMTYFANPAVAKELPPAVQHKTIETGGAILQITDDRLSAQNADHVALAKKVQNRLQDSGLLQKEQIYNTAGLKEISPKP